MTLQQLLCKAHVPRYSRELWFSGAQLLGDVLTVPDEATAGVIRRCYLNQLGAVTPITKLVVVKAEPKPPSAFKAWHGQSNEPEARKMW
jgi:hypothetical protein